MSIIANLRYDRWINFAVASGVMCTAAVLTGALLVGDSMTGSLRGLTLDRLGSVDSILFAPHFIEPAVGKAEEDFEDVVYLSAAVEHNGSVCAAQILGIDAQHSNVLNGSGVEFAVNQALADKIAVEDGAELSLRFLSPQSIPPESALGRKDNLIRTTMTVRQITANSGIGRFSLKNNQQAEPLVIVPLEWLQRKLNAGGKVNAVLIKNSNAAELLPDTLASASLNNIGINITKKGGRFYITSQRLLFSAEQAAAVQKTLPDAESGLLYLVTAIKAVKNGREVPYSTVYCGETENVHWKDSTAAEAIQSESRPPIMLNRWTANDLAVQCGDEIELTWFAADNVNVTKTQKFTLTQIVDDSPSAAALVPEVKGLTDEASIAGWDPPFPFDAKKIRKTDEEYWDKHGAAPKVFVSFAAGRQLFAGRFGNVTTIISAETFHPAPGDAAVFGLNVVPVKALGLAASQGTTPFSVLFLSFSFFIIASALMLVVMLFRLSVEMKAAQIGIRLAAGWTPFSVMRLLLHEGLAISAAGSFAGVLFGILYARLMIYGLSTFWLGAVTVPFLTLHITALSLILGFTGSVFAAMLSIMFSLRKIVKTPVKRLLNGSITGLY
ncbi:MAG: ABC transporter permease [Planctomycetaceae bacterium]|jgi:ABC-type antimicrobial peptide transport system permease subunit|nr:ABC transporter permease [Planctomycetaceae bacterium]